MVASKASMPLLIARIGRLKRHVKASRVLVAVTTAWGIIATFVIAFQWNAKVERKYSNLVNTPSQTHSATKET